MDIFHGLNQHEKDFKGLILHTVSYEVIALAIFDVAKFFLEEEVLSKPDLSAVDERRSSMSKFMMTVIFAVFVEGLVGIFELGSSMGTVRLLYPAGLLVIGALIVVAMAIYEKMSAEASLHAPRTDTSCPLKTEGQLPARPLPPS